MNYINNFDLFGYKIKEVPCIVEQGPPNNTNDCAAGLLYMDSDTGEIYSCIKQNNAYIWKKSSSGSIDTSDIESRLSDLEYKEIDIISFSVSPTKVLLGSTINEITVNYELNKPPTSLLIDNTSYEHSSLLSNRLVLNNQNISSAKNIKLSVTDEREHTVESNAVIKFMNNIYYGSAYNSIINNSFILNLSNNELKESKSSTLNINVNNNQYAWIAVPSRFGALSFTIGGFVGGFSKISTLDITNVQEYTESYDIYRSDNPSLGQIKVQVS